MVRGLAVGERGDFGHEWTGGVAALLVTAGVDRNAGQRIGHRRDRGNLFRRHWREFAEVPVLQ
ncbi:MAG: hypothetical protein CVU24_17590 [Betaproteobacteria bacterium HGW-Betaproteobacteria-18]|nr:MAG: hypothetical protein CVU24_17590 [Betaproteobacteria bacterium HGW-Betaproteobacteria-18]